MDDWKRLDRLQKMSYTQIFAILTIAFLPSLDEFCLRKCKQYFVEKKSQKQPQKLEDCTFLTSDCILHIPWPSLTLEFYFKLKAF